MATGLRDEYAGHPGGAAGWYAEHGADYRNPHEAGVRAAIAGAVAARPERFAGAVLDLACGSGEVALALVGCGVSLGRIDAADPFTGAAYAARVGRPALPYSFADVAAGALAGHGPYSAVVCSFALHLCPRSRLPGVLAALAALSPALLVLTPHKNPELAPGWGWRLEEERYDAGLRVRRRWYLNDGRGATGGGGHAPET